MVRGLARIVLLVVAATAAVAHARAFESASGSAVPVLRQFLTRDASAPITYRALRHLEARTQRLSSSAWMDVWTEADAKEFRYRVAAEGGSESIRNKVFRAMLDVERKSWNAGDAHRAGITPANYTFDDGIAPADGLARLGVRARRKDVLLIDGAIFLKPDDGDLVRMEGTLSKSPSFWTRRVEIVRRYARVGGVRMPVALESVADVVLYGRSTLKMTYEYESINGRQIGHARLPRFR